MKPTESDFLRCAAFNLIRGETPGLWLVSSADPVYLPPTALVTQLQGNFLVLPLHLGIRVSLHAVEITTSNCSIVGPPLTICGCGWKVLIPLLLGIGVPLQASQSCKRIRTSFS